MPTIRPLPEDLLDPNPDAEVLMRRHGARVALSLLDVETVLVLFEDYLNHLPEATPVSWTSDESEPIRPPCGRATIQVTTIRVARFVSV